MRGLLTAIVCAASIGVAAPVQADDAEIHTFHCWMSCPVGAPATNDLIVREIYTLSTNDRTKFADWVAYRITPETIGPSPTRSWQPDVWLAENETLEPKPDDYEDANAAIHVDRGHQAPLAAFAGTPFWPDTNILSNITPQASELNQGAWQRLESKETALVKKEKRALYVVTGPLYERPMAPLPKADEPHVVPSGYWKVIATEDGAVAAFIFEQETPRGSPYCDHQVSVETVEARSKLKLFPRLAVRQLKPLAGRLGCP